jgi:hypothetical protein
LLDVLNGLNGEKTYKWFLHHGQCFEREFKVNRIEQVDFVTKTLDSSRGKIGKREYFWDDETKDFTAKLNSYFKTSVEFPKNKSRKRSVDRDFD